MALDELKGILSDGENDDITACDACDGTGEVDCDNCGGEGDLVSDDIEMKIKCELCEGSRIKYCPECT